MDSGKRGRRGAVEKADGRGGAFAGRQGRISTSSVRVCAYFGEQLGVDGQAAVHFVAGLGRETLRKLELYDGARRERQMRVWERNRRGGGGGEYVGEGAPWGVDIYPVHQPANRIASPGA